MSVSRPVEVETDVFEQKSVVLWSQERLALLKKTLAANLNDIEFELFTEVCKRRALDPFAKQIYAVKRSGNMVIQTSIDGYRLIAERSGRYLGQTTPLWCGKDSQWREVWAGPGNPFASKVGVYKQGHIEPTWGVAYWDTYVAPGPFWQKAGAHMLAKCAEALALKKAFPEELSGLYTDDEMAQADAPQTAFAEARALLQNQPKTGSDAIRITDINSVDETSQTVEATDSNKRVWIFKGAAGRVAVDACGKPVDVLVDYMVDGDNWIVGSARV